MIENVKLKNSIAISSRNIELNVFGCIENEYGWQLKGSKSSFGSKVFKNLVWSHSKSRKDRVRSFFWVRNVRDWDQRIYSFTELELRKGKSDFFCYWSHPISFLLSTKLNRWVILIQKIFKLRPQIRLKNFKVEKFQSGILRSKILL